MAVGLATGDLEWTSPAGRKTGVHDSQRGKTDTVSFYTQEGAGLPSMPFQCCAQSESVRISLVHPLSQRLRRSRQVSVGPMKRSLKRSGGSTALRLYGSTALRLYGQCPVIHIRTANQAGLVEGMPSLGKLQLKPNSNPSIVSAHKKIAEHKFRDFCFGDPNGIRTRVAAVRGQSTRPLYDGAVC